MTAKNMNRCLALVAAILSVFMLLTLTAFAEETATQAETVAATEAVTEAATAADTEAATEAAETSASTSATTEAATSATTSATTEASTEASTGAAGMTQEQKTRGIINLIVGGVLLIAIVALIFGKTYFLSFSFPQFSVIL